MIVCDDSLISKMVAFGACRVPQDDGSGEVPWLMSMGMESRPKEHTRMPAAQSRTCQYVFRRLGTLHVIGPSLALNRRDFHNYNSSSYLNFAVLNVLTFGEF